MDGSILWRASRLISSHLVLNLEPLTEKKKGSSDVFLTLRMIFGPTEVCKWESEQALV